MQEPFPIHDLRYFYRQLTICLSEANLRDVLCRSLFTLEYWLTTIPKYLIGNPRVAVVNVSIHPVKSGPDLRASSGLSGIGLHTKGLRHLVNTLTST